MCQISKNRFYEEEKLLSNFYIFILLSALNVCMYQVGNMLIKTTGNHVNGSTHKFLQYCPGQILPEGYQFIKIFKYKCLRSETKLKEQKNLGIAR
jgi:hypothetical protein